MSHYDDDLTAGHNRFQPPTDGVGLADTGLSVGQRMGCQVLLVESDLETSTEIVRVLQEAGHVVTTVSSFEAATAAASKSPPDLLITGVRLGRFNGLHLAARLRSDNPDLPTIILGHESDVVLAAEAIQLRARFLPRATPPTRLVAFVDDLVAGRAPRDLVSTRRWQRRPTSLPVNTAQGMGWAVDVGYGGMRILSPHPMSSGTAADIDLPTLGVKMQGLFRWTKRAPDENSWWSGFELDSSSIDTRRWRRIVDSLPPQ